MAIQTPIRGLRSFCIAAKCLSFKHAASQLFLTPSAVSHQIKQLEQQLNFNLFERKTRAISLTNKGKNFYQAIQPIIAELETTISDFSLKQQNQTLVISTPEFFASELFIPKLAQWTQLYPQINLHLETVKAAGQDMAKADLSIVLTNGRPNACQVDELFAVRYVPACNPKLYEQWASKGLDALKNVPLILHQSRPWAWHQWAANKTIDNFDPKQIIQLDSMFGVARAAQQGMGIALIPLPISQAWFNENLLIKLFDDQLQTNDKYYLIQHEASQQGSELETFANWVKQQFSDK